MIPRQSNIMEGISLVGQPSLTYEMNRQKNRMTGICDDKEAMKQAIYKILNTERYDCLIYSWNYGIELKDLFGKPINFCMMEIERRITEALLQDERIWQVHRFQFRQPKKGVIAVSFQVETVKGTITAEKEVIV